MRAQYYLPASGQSILSHLQCSKHNMWRQGETPGSFVTLLPNQRSGPGTILGTAHYIQWLSGWLFQTTPVRTLKFRTVLGLWWSRVQIESRAEDFICCLLRSCKIPQGGAKALAATIRYSYRVHYCGMNNIVCNMGRAFAKHFIKINLQIQEIIYERCQRPNRSGRYLVGGSHLWSDQNIAVHLCIELESIRVL